MDICRARIEDTWEAMDKMIHAYYAVGGEKVRDGMPPLSMQWRQFIELEKQGYTLCMQMWHGDKLLGIVLYIIVPHLQYDNVLFATCNTLATDHDHRGRGIGRALMQTAEDELREHGVRFVIHNQRLCYDVEPLFPKLGYRMVEHSFMKELV